MPIDDAPQQVEGNEVEEVPSSPPAKKVKLSESSAAPDSKPASNVLLPSLAFV